MSRVGPFIRDDANAHRVARAVLHEFCQLAAERNIRRQVSLFKQLSGLELDAKPDMRGPSETMHWRQLQRPTTRCAQE